MKRTNLALLTVVVALFAYVTLVERFGLSSGEMAQRERNLLPALVSARLVRIDVSRGSAHFTLSRGERDADGNVRYELVAPVRAEVDSEKVSAAVSAIEWAEPTRVLSSAGASDRARFGLDHPRLRVSFEVADRTVTLAIGRDDPTGAGAYAEADGKFFVVPTEVVEAFDHPVDFFRARSLAEVPRDVTRLRIVNRGTEIRLVREGAFYRVESPYQALASEGRVNVVLSMLRTTEVTRFVEPSPRDLRRFGLDAPSSLVEVGDARRPDAVRLAVGGACEGEPRARFARVGDGPVVCVSDDDLAPLEVDPRAYLELRASATEEGGVVGVDVSDGTKTLSVAEVDDVLHFALGEDQGDADPEAFEEWVESLRTTRAIDVRALDPVFAPTITLTLHRTAARPDDVVRFMPRANEVWARRGTESSMLVFAPAILERLDVSTTHVRGRTLLHDDPADLESLAIERALGTETLRVGEGGEIRVVAPVDVAAESARVADLAARLAGLEAVRFVSDSPRPTQGLDRPRFVLRFAFAKQGRPREEHRLDVGALVDAGDAFARLDGRGPVFVLVGATVELLATPLASRQELATESLFVDGIEVRSGASRVSLARAAAHFVLDGAPIADARANAAVNAVADLRAVEIAGYGPAIAVTGLVHPTTEIRIRRADEAPEPHEIVLAIGSSIGQGEETRVYVRRADRSITYLVPAGSLAPILALTR